MRRSPLFGFALVSIALVSLAATARAEDEKTGAENRYVARMAALPVPSAAHAIDVSAPIYSWEGKPIGTFNLKAQPAQARDGAAVWVVSEMTELTDTPHYWSELATLDRYLVPIRGEAGGNRPKQRPYKVTWGAKEDVYEFERRFDVEGREIAEATTIGRPRPVTATLAAVCLFCRMTLPAKGTFEVAMLSPDAATADDVVQRAMWTQGGTSRWQGRESLVVKGARNNRDLIEIHFHPTTKALLGLRFGRGGQGLQGEVRVPRVERRIPPARTAREAATRGALAFASGDLDLLEQAVHWPTLYATDKAAYEAAAAAGARPFPSMDPYRQAALEGFRETLKTMPRATVEAALKGAEDQVTEEQLADGVIRFTYPPLFKSMKVDVARREGVWYLVRWPDISER